MAKVSEGEVEGLQGVYFLVKLVHFPDVVCRHDIRLGQEYDDLETFAVTLEVFLDPLLVRDVGRLLRDPHTVGIRLKFACDDNHKYNKALRGYWLQLATVRQILGTK